MPLLLLLGVTGIAGLFAVSGNLPAPTLDLKSTTAIPAEKKKEAVETVASFLSTETLEIGTPVRVPTFVVEAPTASMDSTQTVLYVIAGEQPDSSLLPQGALGVPLTNITLTAGSEDVEVTGITIKLRGFGHKNIFESVAIVDDEGEEIGDEKLFRSDNTVTIKESVTLLAGESKTLTVVGNITGDAAEFEGQMPILSFESIEASHAVIGALPVLGNPQSVNASLKIGSAVTELSQFDPVTARTQYINDSSVRFAGIRITASSKENLLMKSITWGQGGTAGAEDIKNVVVVVNGTHYPTEEDDREYNATFPGGIEIKKGQTIDIYLQGDITTTGSNRTVVFEIGAPDDIELVGEQYGFTISDITPGGNTATEGGSVFITSDGTTEGDIGEPFFAGSEFTISSGAVTSIGKN